MKYGAETVERAKSVDLVALVGRFINLDGREKGEMYGPCPLCGGVDRFHIKGSFWFCRHCAPIEGGKGWHDAPELIMRKLGCDFPAAIAYLTGETALPLPAAPRTAQKAPEKAQDAKWLEYALKVVAAASSALPGSAGADYLTGRGLLPTTWQRFNLGFNPTTSIPGTKGKEKAPAILIPWYDRPGLVGVRYRFLQPHAQGKQGSLYGSDFKGMFGKQTLQKGTVDLRTLVICEGEINAMSVWQVTNGWGWDCLSIGSQDQHIPAPAVEYAKQYRRVLVWMDRREPLYRIMHDLGRVAHGFASPVIGGDKADANKLLQLGKLQALLMRIRHTSAQDEGEAKANYWDIWDAVNMDNFALDKEAQDEFGNIGKQIGVQRKE